MNKIRLDIPVYTIEEFKSMYKEDLLKDYELEEMVLDVMSGELPKFTSYEDIPEIAKYFYFTDVIGDYPSIYLVSFKADNQECYYLCEGETSIFIFKKQVDLLLAPVIRFKGA